MGNKDYSLIFTENYPTHVHQYQFKGGKTPPKNPKAAVVAIFTTLPEELSATQRNISLTYLHAQGNVPIAFL